MVSKLYKYGLGNVGDVTRRSESLIDSIMLDSNNAPEAYGVPVKITNGKAEAIEASDTVDDFQGILVRSAPSMSGSLAAGFDDNVPNVDTLQSLLRRGTCVVLCKQGTPKRGGPVYMRVVADTGKDVGDFEAVSDSTNSVLLPDVTWKSEGKDADNKAEIEILICK